MVKFQSNCWNLHSMAFNMYLFRKVQTMKTKKNAASIILWMIKSKNHHLCMCVGVYVSGMYLIPSTCLPPI